MGENHYTIIGSNNILFGAYNTVFGYSVTNFRERYNFLSKEFVYETGVKKLNKLYKNKFIVFDIFGSGRFYIGKIKKIRRKFRDGIIFKVKSNEIKVKYLREYHIVNICETFEEAELYVQVIN